MKALILLCALSLSAIAQAKIYTVSGDSARQMMESLAGSKFEVDGLNEGNWDNKIFNVITGPIICHYTGYDFPDEWLSSVYCTKGTIIKGDALPNSLALAKVIKPYAFLDAGLGHRWLKVNDVKCLLVYAEKKYSCMVDAEVNEDAP